MADRTCISVFFPTPLIFRYHLPLNFYYVENYPGDFPYARQILFGKLNWSGYINFKQSWKFEPCTMHFSARNRRMSSVLYYYAAMFWIRRFRKLGPPGSGSVSQPRIRILPLSSKNSKKNIDFFCLLTSIILYEFFSVKIDVNVPSKSNKKKK